MRFFKLLAGLSLLLSTHHIAFGQDKVMTLSAICKQPEGHLISYQSKDGNPERLKDGFKNAAWSFQWSTATPGVGRVVTQDSESAGSGTRGADASVRFSDGLESISFFVFYESGLWVYTLFPSSRVMVASRHMISAMHQGGSGAVFSAKCDMGIQ